MISPIIGVLDVTGEVYPVAITPDEFDDLGIKDISKVVISGNSREECIANMKALLEKIGEVVNGQ